MKKSPKRSDSKLALGVSLILLGLLAFFGRDKSVEILSSSFKNEPVAVSGMEVVVTKSGELPERIIVPSVSIDLEVKKAGLVDGYWEVFDDSAAWGEGSGFPGEPGNQVIFAHARGGLFLPLRSIKVSDRVYVLSNGKHFSYEVKEIKEVYPGQTEVIAPTDDERVTLYTCSGFADSKRLIVTALRI